MRPLRVDISLRAFMRAPEHLIHLDSILHELIAQRLEVRGDDPDSQVAITAELDKVLARDETDPCRVYCASALQFAGRVERFTETIIRRNSTDQVAEDQLSGVLKRSGLQIQTAFGRERNWLITYPQGWPEGIYAECIADEAVLRDLLADLEYIGGGRRLGHGRIATLEISEGTPEGWRRRNFSAPGPDRVKLISRCTPPYYLRDARQVVFADKAAMENGFF